MISLDIMNKIDSQGMFKIYDRWPEIGKESYKSNEKSIEFQNIDNIIFAGMGGSGTLGDIFFSLLSKTDVHVTIVKGYHVPKTVNENTLIVATSVSGNTIETLTVLKAAKKMSANLISFSSGGKIQEYCNKYKILHKSIPEQHSPRASFTAYLYGMLKILEPILPISENEINESLKELEKLRNNIFSANLNDENASLDLAKWIKGIPLIYYPWGLQASAIRFKNSLQENAKIHVIAEDVIEACHNGIVSWEQPSNVNPILLQGKDDFIKTKERWQIIKEYFRSKNIDFKEIVSKEGGILTKLINLIYLLDYASIYYAVLHEIDPSPISSINFVKEKTEKNSF